MRRRVASVADIDLGSTKPLIGRPKRQVSWKASWGFSL
jgi:hypothetical protein